MGDVNFKIEDNQVKLDLDSNQDGESSVKLAVHLQEAIQEAMSKGEAIEGAKVVDFKFELTKLKLKVDSDKDGEPLLELEVDLAESFDEVQEKLSKPE